MESKNYFWELIFILMPTRVSRRFLLIGIFLLKNVYDLAKNFQIFFKNMLLTQFYLERHVMESKNYFWELIFILMPTRVSRQCLLIGPSFAEKRVWFSQVLPNFLQKYVAYTILSRKTWDGEEKLFLIINLHINAHKGIETIFAAWTVFCWKTCMISELPNFLQKYVAYTILFRKTCDGEQKLFLRINLHINAHKSIETIFADWTVFCWETCRC